MLRRVFFCLNNAQTVANFGYLPLLHEDLLESSVERARNFDACFVTLDFTERIKGADRRLWGYIPVDKARTSESWNKKRGQTSALACSSSASLGSSRVYGNHERYSA
jgi:hypothetical protein